MGKLFICPFHSANKAKLNQQMESMIGWLGSVIELLENCASLLEGNRKREVGFPGVVQSWWIRENVERGSANQLCCSLDLSGLSLSQFPTPRFALYWNNLGNFFRYDTERNRKCFYFLKKYLLLVCAGYPLWWCVNVRGQDSDISSIPLDILWRKDLTHQVKALARWPKSFCFFVRLFVLIF